MKYKVCNDIYIGKNQIKKSNSRKKKGQVVKRVFKHDWLLLFVVGITIEHDHDHDQPQRFGLVCTNHSRGHLDHKTLCGKHCKRPKQESEVSKRMVCTEGCCF